MICKNYFPFYRLSFHFLIVTFKAQQFLNLMMPISIFFPSVCAFGVNFTKIYINIFFKNMIVLSLHLIIWLCWVLVVAYKILSLRCNMQVSWLQCVGF